MDKLKITMPGAGSGFVLSVAQELVKDPLFAEGEFMLYDPDSTRLAAAAEAVAAFFKNCNSRISLKSTTSLEVAVDGSSYIISSCEKNRYPNWVNDFRIPEKYGVPQIKSECGGPGGLIHGLRQIGLYSTLGKAIEKYAPDAWLMSFSNPMSTICTYFKNYTKVKTVGFCHQVHGSFGVVAEMLGLEPGGLEVITAGINHFNWLFDVRLKGTGKSYMKEFLELVHQSPYWKKKFEGVPQQTFTLEMLDVFGMYPVGYDEHILEYTSCFYEEKEWAQHGFKSLRGYYEKRIAEGSRTLEDQQNAEKNNVYPPFPKDPHHPYYAENPCRVISALETNTPCYIDAVNIVNNGAVGNLPSDAILDLPALVIGGEVRSIHVGDLPPGPCELSRRQVALHEMIAQAAVEGDDELVLQALCLDPYVRSITQAKNIWREFRELYREDLINFKYWGSMEQQKFQGASALFPFAVFLFFYLGLSIWSGDFYAIPMPTAFIAASAAALIMGKKTLDEKIEIYARGMGENNIMLMVLIFILAGAFAAVAKSSGAVDSAVLIARHLIPDSFFAAGIFIVASFISLAIGTSCGTVAALTPIATGLAGSAGISVPLMLGAVVGGAMFGDNLSMISDTTIAATRTQGASMKDKFRVNIRIAIPAAVAVLLIYFLTVRTGNSVPAPEALEFRDFLLVLPYAAILICALCGMNVMLLLTAGSIAALVIGCCCGSFTLLAGIGSAGKGTLNMAETLIVALLAGGLLGTIRHNGGISYLISKIEKSIKSAGACEFGCACLVVLINLFTANNTVAIVVAGPVARELSLRYHCDNRRIAAILDTASCAAQGIIPYGAQVLIAVGAAKSSGITVPVNELLSTLYYPMLLAAALIIFIFRGKFFPGKTQRKE